MSEVSEVLSDWLIERALIPDAINVANAATHTNLVLSTAQVQSLSESLSAELIGYGVLAPLVAQSPTDVVVNAPDSVWIDNGEGLRKSFVTFESEAQVRQLAMRLAHSVHRRLDDAQPFVDALLPDGVRLHCVIPPLAVNGTCISLRIPRSDVVPLEHWFEGKDMQQRLHDVLAAGHSLVMSGSTGSGKTTLIRSLLHSAYARHRVVVVEDVAELNVQLPNVVSLQSRLANSDGYGAISMRTLVRQTLRMRPDAIVVGELRGEEAAEWLLATSSGHRGSMTTIHAASPNEARQRLRLLCALANLPSAATDGLLDQQSVAFIHCSRKGSRRFITAIENTCL